MNYPRNFIKATSEYNTFENHVPAPYIRKSFVSDIDVNGKIIIAACGFYELYINGSRITKGFLAPYISNPEHYIYCDEYEIDIDKGENVIGIMLGNGFQNNPGGYIWDFDKAPFRSAPKVLVVLEYTNRAGEIIRIESDESFKTAPSPIRSDDYRFGEFFDANFIIQNWCEKGFDDTNWNNVIKTNSPGGELKICEATPIVIDKELKPVKITKNKNGYIYDFGVSDAGVCRLRIKGQKGQKIEILHADEVKDGELNLKNIWFEEGWEECKDIVHRDTYVLSGDKEEVYMPTFTYHGFRYAEVRGITDEQSTEELLTFVTFHSELETRGGFICSDEVINELQKITRRSDTSNFHYFPTDCPHREKNGWTADAALSCEQMILNFNPEINYREWLRNICKAQNKEGALPGIVPTSGWGFHWGNGPAWDCALAYLPYYVYIYRGETDIIYESAESFMAYLKYLQTRKDEDGLLSIGLGDWCPVGGGEPKTPLIVTDSIIAKDIADKMAVMFGAVGMNKNRDYALAFSKDMKDAVRKKLIDFETMTVFGDCQTSQSMALYYNILEDDELEAGFSKLLELVHKADDHIDVGVLGGRVIFHVLTRFGHSDLAFKMITRKDYPSYGNWIARGATTLWENFLPDSVLSMNHHFWGDISAWFIKTLSGINFNPEGTDITRVEIRPSFVRGLDNAKGFYNSPSGEIISSWTRKEENIFLSLKIPDTMKATVILNNGFMFEDGASEKKVCSGEYKIVC